MLRLRRHVVVLGTIAFWLCPSSVGHAQDLRLLAQCSAPEVAAPSPAASPDEPASSTPATVVSCDLWATDAVSFKEVRASVKGRSERLQVRFEPRSQSLAAMFIIQMMDPSRRALMASMVDTVVKIADARAPKQRFAAYTIANDLNLVADFDASKADFDRKVRAVRGAALPTQLYKGTLEAIGKLAKERADRKALIILGDGNSDDTSYEHDQVVKAAKDAGVIIHALGFAAEAAHLPTFQTIRRLAEDTGGFRREVRVGSTQKYTIGSQFAAEALENGGAARITLREPPGPVTLSITADFAGGRSESVERSLTVPTPPPPPEPTHVSDPPAAADPPEPAAWYHKLMAWAGENPAVLAVSGVAVGLGTIGLALFAFSSYAARKARLAEEAVEQAGGGRIYGWLDMLDGNASQYPLQTTNIRIGRHRDNDICLLNDSISRRHAVLHYNADTRRFVITDLGGGNGVIVNKVRQQSHDLNDGDLVELGEVRLRFRANTEALA
jgi:hypothetical protein